jgi:hypothetical protein
LVAHDLAAAQRRLEMSIFELRKVAGKFTCNSGAAPG